MSTTTRAARTGQARGGRTVVHGPGSSVVGYELRFGPTTGEQDGAVAEAIGAAFTGFDGSRLGVHRSLFVVMPSLLLTGRAPIPFPPTHTVVEVLNHLEANAELVAGLATLHAAGYRIAVDVDVAGPEYDALLPLVHVVRVDARTHAGELADLAAYLRGLLPNVQLFAEGVDDPDILAEASAAGVDLMAGRAFRRVPPMRPGGVQPSQAVSLQLLAALADPDCSIAELERIVSADPGLSLRVLAAVNSAAAATRQVSSLRQGIVLLGRTALGALVMLSAISGNPGSHREDMLTVLTRARTCELLAPRTEGLGVEPSAAYAAGMLSALVDVLGAQPDQLARAARLDASLTGALVRQEGALGSLLGSVVRFDGTAEATTISMPDMGWAELHALGDAMAVLDSILGPPT